MNKLFELESGIDGVFNTNSELLVKISDLPNLFFNLFSFLANPQFLSLHSLVHFLPTLLFYFKFFVLSLEYAFVFIYKCPHFVYLLIL